MAWDMKIKLLSAWLRENVGTNVTLSLKVKDVRKCEFRACYTEAQLDWIIRRRTTTAEHRF